MKNKLTKFAARGRVLLQRLVRLSGFISIRESEAALCAERHRLAEILCKFDNEMKPMREAIYDIANMPEYDQDDAHRMRDKAKRALDLPNDKFRGDQPQS